MLWLAYAGIGLIVVGSAFAAVGVMQYVDYIREVERINNDAKEVCANTSGEEGDRCGKGYAYGLTYNSYRENDAFQSAIIGSVIGSTGVAVFAIGYQRSWITRMTHREKPTHPK